MFRSAIFVTFALLISPETAISANAYSADGLKQESMEALKTAMRCYLINLLALQKPSITMSESTDLAISKCGHEFYVFNHTCELFETERPDLRGACGIMYGSELIAAHRNIGIPLR